LSGSRTRSHSMLSQPHGSLTISFWSMLCARSQDIWMQTQLNRSTRSVRCADLCQARKAEVLNGECWWLLLGRSRSAGVASSLVHIPAAALLCMHSTKHHKHMWFSHAQLSWRDESINRADFSSRLWPWTSVHACGQGYVPLHLCLSLARMVPCYIHRPNFPTAPRCIEWQQTLQ
jgi:hypothetical protein